MEATKLLQLQLLALGFDPAGIDGVIGPGTSNAIRQFQRSIGQNGDGLVTPALKAQLDERTRSKPSAIDVQKSESPPITNTVSGIASPTSSTQTQQEGSKSEKQSDGSVVWGIAIIVGALAAIVWMLFALVKFTRSLPRRFELRARLRPVMREDEATAVVSQMSDSDFALCLSARRSCFRRFLANAMMGDAITPHEAEQLKRIQQLLRLRDNQLGILASQIARAEALGRIDAGMPPEVTNPPINLQSGEKTHLVVSAQLLEERVVGRRYEGGSHGVSFRVMKGVSYRVGASRGRSVSVRGIVPVSSGWFCITNQRLVFSGNAKSFTVDRKKVLSTQIHSDGITISPETGATRAVQFTESVDPNFVQRLVDWVTNPLRIEA